MGRGRRRDRKRASSSITRAWPTTGCSWRSFVGGADPNDGESVYHSAQLNRRECLELVLAHGADLSSRNAAYRNTPLYFLAGHRETDQNAATALEGMRWLLEHGADPNVTSGDLDETPLQCLAGNGWGTAIAELFLAHGAHVDLDARTGDRRSCSRFARETTRSPGTCARMAHPQGVSPVDELLGACLSGDPKALTLLSEHEGLIRTLTPEDHAMVVQAVYEGRPSSVAFMAQMGFDLRQEGSWGGTRCRRAAVAGNARMVEILLDYRAPVNVRDSQYGSSPIAWAAHGSTNNGNRSHADYVAVVGLLLDAGSERPASYNRWNESPGEAPPRGGSVVESPRVSS